MANYNSTHTGAQVDAAVTKANAITSTPTAIDSAVAKANAITSTPTAIDTAVAKANAITSTPSQIDGAVADATKVVANPTLAGTETELTAIEIAGTKYKAGGSGSGQYLHIINLLHTVSTNVTAKVYHQITIYLISGNANQYNSISSVASELYAKGYTNVTPYKNVSGVAIGTATEGFDYFVAESVYSTNGTALGIGYRMLGTGSTGSTSIGLEDISYYIMHDLVAAL